MEKQFLAGEYDDLLGLYNIKKDSSDLDEADVESSILNIWKNVLNNANIKSDDNFFDLGGSSSLLILLTTKIEEKYPDSVSAIDIFEAPTVKELSELIVDRINK